MSNGASRHAQVDQLLLDMGRGVEPDVLVEIYGPENWNGAILRASAGIGQNQDEQDHRQAWEIPDDLLMDCLAHPATEARTLAQGLVHRGWRTSIEGGVVRKFALQAISQLRGRGVDFQGQEAELAWLELGKTHSKHARDPNYEGLTWTQVDTADHLLSALEPHVGLAEKLRKWACSSDCALPNTLLSFRRGQLIIDAARARGGIGSQSGGNPEF